MLNMSKNFIYYLDNYDKKKQNRYNSNIIDNIDKEFSDNFKLNVYKNVHQPIQKDFYVEQYSTSINNLKSSDNSFNFSFNNSFNSALKISRSDTNIQLQPKIKETTVVKTHVEIKQDIECLQDLIDIINKYDNTEKYDYNIDVKLLKKIKPELISLDKMIGIQKLKQNVLDQLLYFIQNLHVSEDGSDYKHTVIYGPPGTGKTEIAKIIGQMYSKIGVLNENKFVKVSRQDLIAGYLGQTAIKTAKVIQKALGGVLFIDEAYSLAASEKEDSFSKECLDTLCESLSNYKGELMVIIAGYEHELDNTFFKVNQGLNSRFIWRFSMDPYDCDELVDIFKKIIDMNNWKLEDESTINKQWFNSNYEEFTSYGRDMEQLFTYTKICHSRRIYGKDISKRKKIIMHDIENGYKMFSDNRKKKQENKHLFSMYI